MNVLLCSRNESVRSKWIKTLANERRIYQAVSYDELISVMRRFRIDIILLHRSVVDRKQLRELCSRKGDSRIFVLADRPEDVEGVFCLQLGCIGYANTYMAPERLAAAVDAVGSGLVWVGSSLMQYLIKGLGGGEVKEKDGEEVDCEQHALRNLLSKREFQVAGLVAEGLSNTAIAVEVGITERTVKAHLSSIYAKTQTKGRLNLALLMKQ